jgi:hypothetical protein
MGFRRAHVTNKTYAMEKRDNTYNLSFSMGYLGNNI